MPIKTDDVSRIELRETTVEGESLDQKPARRRVARRSIRVDSTRNSNVRINVFVCFLLFRYVTNAYFHVAISKLHRNQTVISQERSIGICLKTEEDYVVHEPVAMY